MEKKGKEIKVRFPEKIMGGSYANHMIVLHTKEEFMDLLDRES